MTKLLRYAVLAVVAVGLAACGDTWNGAKQDTADNLKTTGHAVEKSGDKVEGTVN